MLLGCVVGAIILALDPENKEIVLPFQHLMGDPNERVAREESGEKPKALDAGHAAFSSNLMTHNTRVAISTLSLGMTFGIGTFISLFYNGIILGGVSWDYILSGQTIFLLGWLLPHGVVEIPAILIAGQGGLLLASALIGWGNRTSLRERMKLISADLFTLIGGVACLLVCGRFYRSVPFPISRAGVAVFGENPLWLYRTDFIDRFLSRSGRPASAT